MKTGENEEILVSGPNIFPGYWNRPEETARVLEKWLVPHGRSGRSETSVCNCGADAPVRPEISLALIARVEPAIFRGRGRFLRDDSSSRGKYSGR